MDYENRFLAGLFRLAVQVKNGRFPPACPNLVNTPLTMLDVRYSNTTVRLLTS